MTAPNVLDQFVGDRFALYHADCVDVLRGLPDASVHYSIFSPPFASLYVYSASPRDFGNSGNNGEFLEQHAFMVSELFRVMKPGRLVSVHCALIATSKMRDGFIGLYDFRGDLIRQFQRAGFYFHSEVVIWKDPVTAVQRTKALGLLHKQLKKDSAMSRQGIPDYVITMRKPGDNAEPITHDDSDLPVPLWQKYASPVWMDIDSGDTLQFRSAREQDDEKHICLAAGSLVLTREHGYLEIEEVEPGDRVLTHRGRWMPVMSKRYNGVADTVRVCAQGVGGLVATPDHKLFAKAPNGARSRESAKDLAPTWVNADRTLGAYLNLPASRT